MWVDSEEDKHALIASEPKKFSTTPHYDGYPMVLVDLKAVKVDGGRGADHRVVAAAGAEEAREGVGRRPPVTASRTAGPVVADVGLALFVVALGEGDGDEAVSLVEAAGAGVGPERPEVEAVGLHAAWRGRGAGADALAGAAGSR